MPVYGDSLQAWADRLNGILPTSGQRDWSMEVAVHLGLAYAALEQVKALGIQMKAGNKPLVTEALETAWRELLFIRMRNIPPDQLGDVPRIVTLTRTGRIIDGSDQTAIPTNARYYRNPDDQHQSNPLSKSSRRRSRHRGRRTE